MAVVVEIRIDGVHDLGGAVVLAEVIEKPGHGCADDVIEQRGFVADPRRDAPQAFVRFDGRRGQAAQELAGGELPRQLGVQEVLELEFGAAGERERVPGAVVVPVAGVGHRQGSNAGE